VYQNIELRLSQSRVASSVGQLFDLHISRSVTNQFKTAIAQKYASTYDDLLKRLCRGSLLHVDETSAGVMGKEGYVWVLTSMDEVAYLQPVAGRQHNPNHAQEFSGRASVRLLYSVRRYTVPSAEMSDPPYSGFK
jgi:hypothetical protein